MAQIKREGMFLSTRGTKHCVFASDHNVADGQRVWSHWLEDFAAPDDIAQSSASPNAFPKTNFVFFLWDAVPGSEVGCLVPFEVIAIVRIFEARRSTID